MNSILKRLSIVLCVIALVAGVTYILTPDIVNSDRGLHLKFGMPIAVSLLLIQLTAAWYFVSGLKTYQKRFRFAFMLLAAAFVVRGLGQIQLPLIVLTNSLDSLWVKGGIILLPYLFAWMAFYFSMRSIALSLQLPFHATSRWKVGLTGVGVAALATRLPHVRINTPRQEFSYDVYMAMVGWSITLTTATFLIGLRVANSLGPLYSRAMKLPAAAFGLYIVAWALEWASNLFLYANNWFTQRGLEFMPMLVATIVALAAAIAFKEISRQTIPANANFIDVVIHVSQLVSDPRQIDVLLDRLRVVTARLKPGQELTAKDKTELVHVYESIEEYIVTKEPLRKLSREELRARLPEHFLKALS